MSTSSPEPGRRRRVAALAPEDRRAAIVAATVPLLWQHGLGVTTRQIADAAGVAEGTLFGVFPDKASLIHAAVTHALDPEPAVHMIRASAEIADLRSRLEHIAARLGRGMSANMAMLAMLRPSPPAEPRHLHHGPPEVILRSRAAVVDALADVIGPDRARLRRSPAITAQLLVSLIFASASGRFAGLDSFDSTEVVSLLLDGLLVQPDPAPGRGQRPRDAVRAPHPPFTVPSGDSRC